MSEIKVNKISPRTNCGTVTLGDSGDTFTIPAGATITNNGTAAGFGATGAASWDTTVKTSGFTAVSGVGYFVNTTAGAISVNLPAGTAGDVVAFKDYANTFDSNAVTLVQNGSDKIGGSTTNAVLDTEGTAITLVFIDSTQGWLVTDSGLQTDAPTPQFITATGGTITTVCTNYKVHTFTGPGTFTVCTVGNAAGSNTVDYLVVAGGGSGGGANGGGGGGGAGGFRLANTTCMPAPLTSPLASSTAVPVTATGFPITVGAGASGRTGAGRGSNGSNSIFSTITSAGGGGGGGTGPSSGSGLPGGSGGGEGGASATGGAGSGNTPPVSPPQGNDGGDTNPAIETNQGSGGGGAGAAGSSNGPTPNVQAGPGGDGSFVVQTGFAGCNGTPGPVGSTRYFAGGGGGNSESQPVPLQGQGGAGGGGTGGQTGSDGGSGTTNTGGGGGGIDTSPSGFTSGAGGSGIVIIRYRFQ